MIGSLSQRMRILVIASLALNVFGIGAIAADTIMGQDGRGGLFWYCRPPRFMGVPSPHELREVLPDSDDAKLDQLLQANRTRFHERLEALFAARQQVADAIRAEPFERAKLETAFAALREREEAMASGSQAWLADFIGRLDPEGRAKVAELLTRRHQRRDKGSN
jgi:uncharacterized membrane protein